MTLLKTLSLFGAVALIAMPFLARAEGDEIEQQEPKLEAAAKTAGYEAKLKERYKLTDEQLKKLHDDGMKDSQITIAAQLAKASGKSIEDIEKMRLEQKMGWGKIAKELGVPPREIGQSIASMHRNEHSVKEDKRENRDHESKNRERKEERAEHRSGKAGKG
jgi:hypothetical protein